MTRISQMNTKLHPANWRSPFVVALVLTFTALMAVLLFAPGCGTFPLTIKAGADPVIVTSEHTQETALDVFDTFLAWERRNEAALLTLNPRIHDFAEKLRAPDATGTPFALRQINTLRSATHTYKMSKDGFNRGSLAAIQSALNALVAEARLYLEGKVSP